MNLWKDPVKFVIFCGLIIAALLIGYNAFYFPKEQEVVFVADRSENSVPEISVESSAAVVSQKPKEANKININTADKETLTELDGIGETLAQRIIDYRAENGSFHSIDDLMNVSGIGEQKFNAVKSEITV